MHRLSGAATLCFLLVASASARAEDREARNLLEKAEQRLAKGDVRGEIEFLQRADAIAPDPATVLKIAQAYDKLASGGDNADDLRLAIVNYRQYLQTGPHPPPAEVVQRLDALKAELNRRLDATLKPPPPLPADRFAVEFFGEYSAYHFTVTVNDQTCETPCTLYLSPGPTKLIATGSEHMELDLFVPRAQIEVLLRPAGERFIVPGILLTAVGVLVAGGLWALQYTCPGSGHSSPLDACELTNVIAWPVAGAVLTAGGAGLLGYYYTHLGSRAEVTLVDAETTPSFHLASFGFQPLPHGGAAGAVFSF